MHVFQFGSLQQSMSYLYILTPFYRVDVTFREVKNSPKIIHSSKRGSLEFSLGLSDSRALTLNHYSIRFLSNFSCLVALVNS